MLFRSEARHRAVRALGKQDDRALTGCEEPLLGVTQFNDGSDGCEVGGHHGERFVCPSLSMSQTRDRPAGSCIAREMESAEALDGDRSGERRGGKECRSRWAPDL